VLLATSATLRANLTQGVGADVWFLIGKSTNSVDCSSSSQANAQKASAPALITRSVDALEPNTIYQFRACAKGTKGGISSGALTQFITKRNIGKVGKPIPTFVSKDTITVNAKILEGVGIDAWFVIGLQHQRLSCGSVSHDGRGSLSAGDTVPGRFTGLDPSTTYKIQSCAKGPFGSANAGGAIFVATNNIPQASCGPQAFQGGTHGLSVVFVLFNAFDIPDGIRILERDTNNVLLTSNGLVSGIYTSSFPAGGVSAVDVYVQGNSNQNTRWELTITCPQ